MKDAGLKEILFKHYWAQGCFVQPEVDIHFQEGVDGSTKAITDVDVYALRPHPELYFERVLGDCKTLKVSPIARVLWLRGLMDLLGARAGCLLLGPGARIERDHRLTSNHLGITLLNQMDFYVYDKSIVFPSGSDAVVISVKDINFLKQLPSRFPKLGRLTQYLYRDAWREESPAKLIRHTIGVLRQARGEFDPAKVEHIALLCDAAAIFSIGVAEIAGKIFQQYLHPEDKNTLSESLRVILWGGQETYAYFTNLRRKIIQLQGGNTIDDHDNLELPEWNTFIQLIRNILENPYAAFFVPQLLRRMASDILNKAPVLDDANSSDLLSLKFAMLTVTYLFKATEVPHEFEKIVNGDLIALQSQIVSSNRKFMDNNQNISEKNQQMNMLSDDQYNQKN